VIACEASHRGQLFRETTPAVKHRHVKQGLGALEVSTGSTITRVARAFDRVAAGVREQAAARAAIQCPRILHVDEDPAVLRVVAESLGPMTDIVSVQSADAARRALLSNHFDLAVLDIALASGSSLDLLPDLRNREGDPIPLIVFSPKDVTSDYARRTRAPLTDSSAAIDGLVTMLRKRLRNHGVHRTEH